MDRLSSSCGSAGVQSGADQPRLSLAADHGAPEAGSDAAAGAGRYGCGHGATLCRRIRRRIKAWGAAVEPLKNDFLLRSAFQLVALLGAVGFVLVITCVNIANLLLAKGSARSRDCGLAVRWRNRRQIFPQFLTESVVLALIGGGLGIALGVGLLRAILSIVPRGFCRRRRIFSSIFMCCWWRWRRRRCGILFGCAPRGTRREWIQENR